MPTLYSFGNAANVSSNNFTTLYNTGAGIVNPQMAYGNANVVGLLAVGTDGGNTIGNIVASGNINTSGNISAGGNVYADYIVGSIIGNVSIPGNNTEVLFNAAGGIGTDSTFTFNTVTNTLSVDVVSASGNITGNYFLGNGSQLSGLPAGYSNAQVASYLSSGGLTSNITTSANVSASYFLGNGSQLTGIASSYGNANVVSLLASFGSNTISTTGNITGGVFAGNGSGLTDITGTNVTGTVGLAQYVTANAQANITSVGTLTSLTASGNISTTGNVTGNYILGNGSQLTGLPATYGNANVEAYLASGTNTSNIITSGNVTGNYFLGNGSQLTGLPEIYGNANVVSLLASFGSNTISTTGNITGGVFAGNGSGLTDITGTNVTGIVDLAQYVTANAQANITSVGILTGLDATGNISTTGNITGNYFLGNGSQLTGLPEIYGNANVAAYLASGTNTSNIITTGNISGGNILTIGIVSATAGLTTADSITALGNISTTGNVIGSYLWGDGSNITGVVAGSESIKIPVKNTSGGTLTKGSPVYATGTVGATDVLEIAASRADTAATMPCVGLLETTLTVNATGYVVSVGHIGTYDTSTYSVGQTLYVAAAGGLTNVRPDNGYLVQPVATVGRINASTGSIEVNSWNYFQLPNLGSGNIWYGNTNSVPTQTTLATFTGNIGAGNITVSGTISATGTVSSATDIIAGGNLQATGNIRTTGAAGNITGANYIAANYFVGDGGLLSNISGGTYGNANVETYLASGTNTSNIITTGNVTGGNITTSGLITVGTTVSAVGNVRGGNILTAGLITATGNITGGNLITAGLITATGNIISVGNISGSYFLGNGSQLTGISTSLPANVTANVFTSQVYSYGNATGTITPDISLGSIQTMTLTGNITLNALSNVASGQSATFIMTQDATGNRLITSTWKFASNVRTLSTAANAVDMISVTYIGSTYYASLIRGFA